MRRTTRTLVVSPAIALASLLAAMASAQEIPQPVDGSAPDWTCETASGDMISGHQQQHKATPFRQSAAMADPAEPLPAGGAHAYYRALVRHPAHHYHLSARNIDEVLPLAWAQAKNYDRRELEYDADEDAIRHIFETNEANGRNFGPGFQRGTAFPTVSSGSVLVYWESKWDGVWADKSGGTVGGLRTHKAFIIRGNLGDDRALEVRNRYDQAPRGSVSLTDIRQYGSGLRGPGGPQDGLAPRDDNFTIQPMVWTYFWVYVDFVNGEVTYWIKDEHQSAARVYDSVSVSFAPGFGIDGFYFRHNSSQTRTGPPTSIWDRNLVVLSGLSKREAQALVARR